MHVNPPNVFVRDLQVVPAGPMLFCALRKVSGVLGGRTGFISQIISLLAAISWEGNMFHDLSLLNLGFGHLRRDLLEGFQVDATS